MLLVIHLTGQELGWTLAVLLLTGLLLVYFLGRFRTRLLEERARKLEQLISERTGELEEAIRRLERQALFDELTNLPNRRCFWQEASRLEARAHRHGHTFALVVIDLDEFKKINDRWGHRVGDEALVHVAAVLGKSVREGDAVARYGGEEFVALFIPGDAEGVHAAAERMRAALEGNPFEVTDGPSISISASFGIGAWQGPEDNLDDVFRRADAALYEAKRQGKNRIVLWHQGLKPSDRETGPIQLPENLK